MSFRWIDARSSKCPEAAQGLSQAQQAVAYRDVAGVCRWSVDDSDGADTNIIEHLSSNPKVKPCQAPCLTTAR